MQNLKRRLAPVVRKAMETYSVPGVSIGIVHGGVEHTMAAGVTCTEFPQDVDAETLFQIGSTTKTFTGTALMMLVEEGLIDLDATVRTYLPSFKLKDAATARAATVRHLVTHTGGWRGDYFDDLGRGDDALKKIVRRMATKTPQVTPLGTAWSYNNAGFYVLGRILEEVTGMRYEDLITTRIFQPLGMERSFFFPEDVITRKAALGHIARPDGSVIVSRPWALPRSAHPAGGIVSSVEDQLRYMAFHLGNGTAGDGTRLMRSSTLKSMRKKLAPAGSMAEAVGVTWLLDRVGTTPVVKHGGSWSGQMSDLWLIPREDFGITVLTNGSRGHELSKVVIDWVVANMLDLHPTPPAPRPLTARAASAFTGIYEVTPQVEMTIAHDGDGLVLNYAPTKKALRANPDFLTDFSPTPPLELVMVGRDRAVAQGGYNTGARVEFIRDENKQVAFVRAGGRMHPRAH
ncbi:MAG: serine hydrolase domain-containing protein [Acidimicrobiales bacterium]